MKTLSEMRVAYPELAHLSDDDLEQVRNSLYALARVALALCQSERGSNNGR